VTSKEVERPTGATAACGRWRLPGSTWLVWCWLGLALVSGCDKAGQRPDGPLRIVVSIAPLTSLAADLAPPGAEVATLIPAGSSLHSHEVTPADLALLGRADIVVYNGLGLDPLVAGFLSDHPSDHRTVVCFAEAVGLIAAEDDHAHDGHGHDHDPGHDHGHSGEDQHLWLDPSLVARLVPEIGSAISRAQEARGSLSVEERSRLASAQADLLARVDALDREYAARLAPLKGRAIVTHHDAFRRVADRYGLRISAIIRPIESAEPTPGAIAAAAEAARAADARAVFFEPQFDPASAERIAEAAGARLGRLDPEGDSDWVRLMRGNLESLVTNLGDSPTGAEPGAR
jgi:zinc transport system substrate-binding protein